MKIQDTSQWRWLLGYSVPGFLVRISWVAGSSWMPGMDFLMMRWAEFVQVVLDGFCSVFFAGYVAPRRARVVRLVAATMTVIGHGGFFIYVLLTGYYQGVPTVEVSWQIVGLGNSYISRNRCRFGQVYTFDNRTLPHMEASRFGRCTS